MPPSRPLRSRTGCLRCRVRRKKCDEAQPECNNCQRLGLKCVWRGKDKLISHVLTGNRVLGTTQTLLLMHQERVSYPLVYSRISFLDCPRNALSSGYPPLRSDIEHRLMQMLHGFLNMLMLPQARVVPPDHSHVFAAALQHLWVRDALVAFAAFASSARDSSLRVVAYESYHAAIKHVQKQITSSTHLEVREELLIATVFLGLMELYNPENQIRPLLHFEAVGHLLQLCSRHVSSSATMAQSLFHRITFESYIYHVSMLSLFYPETDRYTEISPYIERKLSDESIGVRENVVTALDINIYRVLFTLTVLARTAPSRPGYAGKLRATKALLDVVTSRTLRGMQESSSTSGDKDFWRLSKVASNALHILFMKVENKSLLATDSDVLRHLTEAITGLNSCVVSRAWTGNLVWILTILLCAAHITSHCETLHRLVQKFISGIWGADRARLEGVLQVIRTKRGTMSGSVNSTERILELEEHDTLAVLLDPRGVLAAL